MNTQGLRLVKRNQQGFTLIELLIAAFISVVVLGLVAQVFTTQRRTFDLQTSLGRMVANGRGAIDLMQRTIQNTGYKVERGRKFLAASDRYVTMVYDADDNGSIENTEVFTYAVSNAAAGSTQTISISPYFDQNGNGIVSGTEQRAYTYDLNITAPPYNFYQYIPNVGDSNYTRQVVAEHIDYVIFRYYDSMGNELGEDDNNPGVAPGDTDLDGRFDPPFTVPVASLNDIRRVTVEFMVRTKEEDPKPIYTNSGTYPAGSVATAGGSTYSDKYHRQIFNAEGSPRNLIMAPWGKIQIVPGVNPVACPTSSTTFTATLLDASGEPIPATTVNFNTSDSDNITLSPASGTSDGNGDVTGTVTYNWNQPSNTITVSANSQLTIDGKIRPIYNAMPVAFTSGTGVFTDDFADGANDWTPVNSSAWDDSGGTYKIFPLPSGQVNLSNALTQVSGDTTPGDITSDLAYTVPTNLGNNLILVAVAGADAATPVGANVTVVDTTSPVKATSATVTVNARTSNDKRMIILVTSCECYDQIGTAPTAGGASMTLIGRDRTNSGADHALEMWAILDAGLPAAAGSVTVNYSGLSNGPMMALWSLQDVTQAIPAGAQVNTQNVPDSTDLAPLNITTAANNSLVLSAAGNGDESCNFNVHTPFGLATPINSWEGEFATSARFTGSWGNQATAGSVTVNVDMNVTGGCQPRRGAQVVAAFAPEPSYNALPTGVTFNGAPMNGGSGNLQAQAGTGPATGVAMYWLSVSPGDSGNIIATYPGASDERRLTALTLYDVQGLHATQIQSAVDAVGGNAQATVTPDAAGQLILTGGHHSLTATGAPGPTGTDHQFAAGNLSSIPNDLRAGGIGFVPTPTSGTPYTLGYSSAGTKEREAVVTAVFEPAPVNLINQISSTGCSPWTNYEMVTKVTHNVSTTTNHLGGGILRYQDDENYYWLRLEGTGVADQFRLKIIKVVADVPTELATSTPMSVTNGTAYWLKVKADDDDLKIRWWLDGASEPGTWDVEFTDAGTTFTGGRVGLLVNQGDFVFDDVQVSPT